MNESLKTLSDERLHQNTLVLVAEERRITTQVLEHLQEISARQLYLAMGYSSLWEYCTKALKYSEAATHRRISAMRAMADVPEIKEAIEAGELTLTTIAQVQTACRREKRLDSRALLKEAAQKSTREVERLLAAQAPQATKPDRQTSLNEDQTEIRFTADQALLKKLERIKDLCGHKIGPNPTYAELLHHMADVMLKRIDPSLRTSKNEAPPAPKVPSKRYIPAKLRRAVFLKAELQCEFIDCRTQHRCTQRRRLEIDHILPYAMGGTHAPENLRVVCRSHNQWLAMQTYGKKKVEALMPAS